MPADHAVRDLLERSTLVQGSPDMRADEAARRMAEGCCGSILVVEQEKLVGIFTERDMLNRVVAKGRDPAKATLAEVMTRDPDTIEADAHVADAIRMLDEFGYRYLPVLDNGRVIGVVSNHHFPFADVLAMAGEIEARHALTERLR
jgi:CBS domain-containing protein